MNLFINKPSNMHSTCLISQSFYTYLQVVVPLMIRWIHKNSCYMNFCHCLTFTQEYWRFFHVLFTHFIKCQHLQGGYCWSLVQGARGANNGAGAGAGDVLWIRAGRGAGAWVWGKRRSRSRSRSTGVGPPAPAVTLATRPPWGRNRWRGAWGSKSGLARYYLVV